MQSNELVLRHVVLNLFLTMCLWIPGSSSIQSDCYLFQVSYTDCGGVFTGIQKQEDAGWEPACNKP